MKVLHASDCAVHNAPALPVGPCDCGAMLYTLLVEARDSLESAVENAEVYDAEKNRDLIARIDGYITAYRVGRSLA